MLQFRGKTLLLAVLLAVSMFPQVSVIAPLFLALRELRLIDTYVGLALPHAAFATPLAVWLLTALFRQLPRELEEAAAIDGCGPFRFFLMIALPMSRPVLATISVLAIVHSTIATAAKARAGRDPTTATSTSPAIATQPTAGGIEIAHCPESALSTS